MDFWATVDIIAKALVFVWFVGLCWIVSGHTKRLDRMGEHKDEGLTDIRELIEDLDDRLKLFDEDFSDFRSGISTRILNLDRAQDKAIIGIDFLKSGMHGSSVGIQELTDKAFELGRIQENLDKMGDSISKAQGMILADVADLNKRVANVEERLSNVVDPMTVEEEENIVAGHIQANDLEISSETEATMLGRQYANLSNDFAAYREEVTKRFGYAANAEIETTLLLREESDSEGSIVDGQKLNSCCEIKQEVISADVISSEKIVPEKDDPYKIG